MIRNGELIFLSFAHFYTVGNDDGQSVFPGALGFRPPPRLISGHAWINSACDARCKPLPTPQRQTADGMHVLDSGDRYSARCTDGATRDSFLDFRETRRPRSHRSKCRKIGTGSTALGRPSKRPADCSKFGASSKRIAHNAG
jgi:hypothetical protein